MTNHNALHSLSLILQTYSSWASISCVYPIKTFQLANIIVQAFIKTAATIYKKIQDGVFDVSNEVGFSFVLLFSFSWANFSYITSHFPSSISRTCQWISAVDYVVW